MPEIQIDPIINQDSGDNDVGPDLDIDVTLKA